MKIIIVGAGQVGGTLAENLAREYNDITVVDVDGKALRVLQDRLDIRTVAGIGSHPDVLVRAGIEDADMLVAVTNSDEVNIIACQVAYSLFTRRPKSPEFALHYTIQILRQLFTTAHAGGCDDTPDRWSPTIFQSWWLNLELCKYSTLPAELSNW